MVVEDEPPIMRQIVKLINEYGDDIKVTATAGNGRKALEILEEEKIDVVFTDIKMPVVDGLELAEQIKTKFPDLMVVIVSGYQDFQYARKAIQFHVYDYLLKPVSKDAIRDLLTKIENEIRLKRNKEKKEKVRDLINISGNALPEDNLSFAQDARYALLLVCAGAFPLIPDDSMLPARNFWEQVNIEQIMGTIILQNENCICFNGKSAAEMVIAVELKEKDRVIQITNALFEKLKERSNLAITIAASNTLLNLNDIGARLKTLRMKLYVGIKLFTSQIIWNDTEISNMHIDMKLAAETLNFAIKSGSAQLRRCLENTLNQFLDAGLTQIQIVNFFDGLINNSEFINSQISDCSSTLKMEIYSAISNAVDISSLVNDLLFVFSSIYNYKDESTKYNNQSIAKRIEEYLKDNYRKTITNTLLSKKFGFVPSYISKIFREYKGVSPSEFLTDYRIKIAKKLMLEQPELMFKEIAEMVGYKDPHYFSKIFKKETGMWPTEFRECNKFCV